MTFRTVGLRGECELRCDPTGVVTEVEESTDVFEAVVCDLTSAMLRVLRDSVRSRYLIRAEKNSRRVAALE